MDFDLAVLSKSEDVYYQYTIDIRKEYKRYPNFLYKNGRAGVLKGFLDKEQIYLTKEFSCFEEKARKNIENEINLLTSSKKIKAV